MTKENNVEHSRRRWRGRGQCLALEYIPLKILGREVPYVRCLTIDGPDHLNIFLQALKCTCARRPHPDCRR